MSLRLTNNKLFLSLSIICFILVSSVFSAEQTPFLRNEPVVLEKPAQVITNAVYRYLNEQDKERVKIWVFFTDKKVYTADDFSRRAEGVVISERSLKRRAKVAMDKVVFADLPVVEEYIRAIVDLGARHRRSSKWLNAASFEIPLDMLDRVKELPFVNSIKPMVGYKLEYAAEQKTLPTVNEETLTPDALNYGSSLGQLEQINVPAVHAKGYTGKGVTLAVFDTGFRKSHEAFAMHYNKGRVLGEWDFIFEDGNTANEAEDVSEQWNHGTGTWGVSGGYKDGSIYGPAYQANFLLAKTEDTRAEYQGEEDNWVAALEWADAAGADVVTSSLSYSDWYVYLDFDGQTATTTLAANMADGMGIVVCNSMGNSGPASGTLGAPADAFDILSIGAVSVYGTIASFSSRGPTADGRTKPEVCAQGVNTYWVSAATDNSYGTASGTSLSCPLVAGAACLLIEARPDFTPELIRTALMETASRAATPDNNYGWGIIDVNAALDWGANFEGNVTIGDAPLAVDFTDLSTLSTPTWDWNFGDGGTSGDQNPSHEFTNPGMYNVSLTIETSYGTLTNEKRNYIIALADTLRGDEVEGPLNTTLDLPINLTNNVPLYRVQLPVEYDGVLGLKYMGYSLDGCRAADFDDFDYINYDANNKRFTLDIQAGAAEYLPAGSGPLIILRFKIESAGSAGESNDLSFDGYSDYEPRFYGDAIDYQPRLVFGSVIY
ncbi:MAG: S8 family serine peptidase, partial [candidate division Zixibacteria bacterium]|nr:S8 family serine peptidase [candidate division Zixibacteria bacterium]